MQPIEYKGGPTRVPAKDPDSVLDFKVDWSEWLDGDTIATAVFLVDSGITEDSSTNSDTAATIWLSGGTAGVDYNVVSRITTAQGRTADRTIIVPVAEK
jgi:aryl-phospho-beta-D-glucosidase BglC (GH1 family)